MDRVNLDRYSDFNFMMKHNKSNPDLRWCHQLQGEIEDLGAKEAFLKAHHIMLEMFPVTATNPLPDDLVTTAQVYSVSSSAQLTGFASQQPQSRRLPISLLDVISGCK